MSNIEYQKQAVPVKPLGITKSLHFGAILLFASLILITLSACISEQQKSFENKLEQIARQAPVPVFYNLDNGKPVKYIKILSCKIAYDAQTGKMYGQIVGQIRWGFWDDHSIWDHSIWAYLSFENTAAITPSMLEHPEKFYWYVPPQHW